MSSPVSPFVGLMNLQSIVYATFEDIEKRLEAMRERLDLLEHMDHGIITALGQPAEAQRHAQTVWEDLYAPETGGDE